MPQFIAPVRVPSPHQGQVHPVNAEAQWPEHTELVVTERGNVALKQIPDILYKVFRRSFAIIAEDVAFQNAFPDANVLDKELYIRNRVIKAAEEHEEDVIVQRCRHDRHWFSFVKSLVGTLPFHRECRILTVMAITGRNEALAPPRHCEEGCNHEDCSPLSPSRRQRRSAACLAPSSA